jgi:hypothetical protein
LTGQPLLCLFCRDETDLQVLLHIRCGNSIGNLG